MITLNSMFIMKKKYFISIIICLCLFGCKDKENQDGELVSNAPEKAFSVASDKYVKFAQGNLRHNTATNEYRISDHQYDMIGNANYHSPWSFEDTNTEVWQDLFYDYDLDNGISITNAGNKDWKLLNNTQWEYLISGRPNSYKLYGVGIVNNVNGLILLPDKWDFSNHKTFNYGLSGSFNNNAFTLDEWKEYENDGAVFLPASGRMSEDGINTGKTGEYWTGSTQDTNDNDYSFFFLFQYDDWSIARVESGGDFCRAYRFVEFVQ